MLVVMVMVLVLVLVLAGAVAGKNHYNSLGICAPSYRNQYCKLDGCWVLGTGNCELGAGAESWRLGS
jgi:hypothetical protein